MSLIGRCENSRDYIHDGTARSKLRPRRRGCFQGREFNFFADNGLTVVQKAFWVSSGDRPAGSMAVYLASADEARTIIDRRTIKIAGQIAYAKEFQKITRPVRCYNCNQYGHYQSRYSYPTTCGRCAQSHRRDSCTSGEKKCPACTRCPRRHRSRLPRIQTRKSPLTAGRRPARRINQVYKALCISTQGYCKANLGRRSEAQLSLLNNKATQDLALLLVTEPSICESLVLDDCLEWLRRLVESIG
jgi:hypothetical protein